MERIDVSEERRLADLVAAVERGEEVVIVRDGAVVAEVKAAAVTPVVTAPKRSFDMAALEEFHVKFPVRIKDASALIREIRDAED